MLREQASTAEVLNFQTTTTQKPKTQSYMKPYWWDDLNAPAGGKHHAKYRPIVKNFLEGKMEPRKRIKVDASNGLWKFYTKEDGNELWLFKDNPSIKVHIPVIKKIGDIFVGNSSSMVCLRQQPGKGYKRGLIKFVRSGPLNIQEVVAECCPMLPFRTFKEIKLDINSVDMVDRGPAETLQVGRTNEPIHFTGAMVFKVALNKRSQGVEGRTHDYFLFDVDRNEVKLKNFNAFISKLSRPVTSIQDAYDSLKPQEVVNAERFIGEVQRQGEWFFIPVQGEYKQQEQSRYDMHRTMGKVRIRGRLQAKGNRAHFTQYMSAEGYVKGKVGHEGGEHKMIDLKGWCKPVPNSATESYKISGDVD